MILRELQLPFYSAKNKNYAVTHITPQSKEFRLDEYQHNGEEQYLLRYEGITHYPAAPNSRRQKVNYLLHPLF